MHNVQLPSLLIQVSTQVHAMGDTLWKKKLVRFMEDNRGLIVLFFCLPASLIFDLILQLRNWFYRVVLSAPQRHDERVRNIKAQVCTGYMSYSLFYLS